MLLFLLSPRLIVLSGRRKRGDEGPRGDEPFHLVYTYLNIVAIWRIRCRVRIPRYTKIIRIDRGIAMVRHLELATILIFVVGYRLSSFFFFFFFFDVICCEQDPKGSQRKLYKATSLPDSSIPGEIPHLLLPNSEAAKRLAISRAVAKLRLAWRSMRFFSVFPFFWLREFALRIDMHDDHSFSADCMSSATLPARVLSFTECTSRSMHSITREHELQVRHA